MLLPFRERVICVSVPRVPPSALMYVAFGDENDYAIYNFDPFTFGTAYPALRSNAAHLRAPRRHGDEPHLGGPAQPAGHPAEVELRTRRRAESDRANVVRDGRSEIFPPYSEGNGPLDRRRR